ncbi:MAG: 6-bladed beta-propeller [Bacteroidetes bacterium]|nr:6-bladed beta-propeller [Bacteroidota bacterium]MBT5427293.1 6-bladed beta-propeller [Bacteroidota bacterium]MBT7095355.1 6-bladed beta-propeller [Bacteroidota bacterium]MBT7464713.1 6-bladed beta-propeller [Bacteroidota bacterium]
MKRNHFPCSLVVCLSFACLTMYSCGNQADESQVTEAIQLKMDPNNLPPVAMLSELVTSVRIVPLETKPDCLIGSVGRLFVGQSDIILVGHNNPSELMRFSTNGKFKNKIGREGSGPGEYQRVWEITPFEDSAVVYLNMQSRSKSLAYNFDGTFIGENTFPRSLRNPKVLDDHRIAFNSNKFEVRIANSLTQDTLDYIPTSPQSSSRIKQLSGNPQTGFFYTGLGRDTIWRIDSDSMRPQIICDFGTGHFSSSDYIGSIGRSGGYPPGHFSIGGGVFYGSGYYHFALLRQKEDEEYRYFHIVVSEKTGKSWHLEQSDRSDDVLFCTSTDFSTCAHSGEWVAVVGAYELIDALPKIEANQGFTYPAGLIDQIKDLSIDQNPVLVFYTLQSSE